MIAIIFVSVPSVAVYACLLTELQYRFWAVEAQRRPYRLDVFFWFSSSTFLANLGLAGSATLYGLVFETFPGFQDSGWSRSKFVFSGDLLECVCQDQGTCVAWTFRL